MSRPRLPARTRLVVCALSALLPVQLLAATAGANEGPATAAAAATEYASVPVERAPIATPTTTPAEPPTPTVPTTTAPTVLEPPPSTSAPTPVPAQPRENPPGAPAPPPAAPSPPADPPAPVESAEQRVTRALAAGVPERWRNAIPVRLQVIEGSTSWARGDGLIMVGSHTVAGGFDHLADVIAHEFGHQIAFRHGTQAYAGAPPAGWPAPTHRPEEAWADCVQTVFTGRTNPSHGLPPCAGDQLTWARSWLQTFAG